MTATLGRIDRHARLTALAVLLGVALMLTLMPDAAMAAASNGEDVGKNFGDLLQDYATQIYLGIVAIVSLVFLVNRAYSQLGMFMIAAVAVGMMVVAPDQFQNFAKDTANALFSG